MVLLAASDKVNPLGHALDMPALDGALGGITIHFFQLGLVVLLLLLVMTKAAAAIGTGPASEGNDRYLTRGRFFQLLEVIILYLRDKAIRPVLGHATERWLPFLLSVFFFILFVNVLGLVPLLDLQHLLGTPFGNSHFAILGGTPTANLSVTAALALCAFVAIQVHAFRELGLGGWAHHLLGGAPWYLAPLMVPIELMGLIIKPAALAIRLFANMLAGHTLMATLALFGLMALQGIGSWIAALGISAIAALAAVAITFLELFVAFLQAFIFMFLTAVFLGQMNHHGDHAHHAEAEAH
ncbi:MAG: F0F1 ATP synthase subunit A [Phycisphaeraceae bacterium]|nr:F0F1 ATP synthase subunit A [Phycisphaeraceae bacterium]